MSISESILPEFDHEMANTRKTLERVPEEKFHWRTHEKSFSMGALASHLANLPNWAVITLQQDSFDTAPLDAPAPKMAEAHSVLEVLQVFDKNVEAARAAIASASDEQMRQSWSLKAGGKTIFSMPRIAAIRSFIMSHSIHHRAQLGVYLRLNDIPVPSIYGPSADESAF
ncbi:MAG: DinB family protein [Acidobacteria bacterium]|nr:DinB family protein [Acidobacteriota bacterium]